MKTIIVYDLNVPSLMATVCIELKEKGAKIIRVDELSHIGMTPEIRTRYSI